MSAGVPGSLTVLLVDDDASVRGVLVAAFTKWGHRCIEAADGELGLAVLRDARERGEVIHGVVLDLIMPRMGGRGFLEEMARRGYVYPVVVLTAFPESPACKGLDNVKVVLSKPVAMGELKLCAETLFGHDWLADETIVEPPRESP